MTIRKGILPIKAAKSRVAKITQARHHLKGMRSRKRAGRGRWLFATEAMLREMINEKPEYPLGRKGNFVYFTDPHPGGGALLSGPIKR